MNSIRVVPAVCAAYSYVMEQLDADTAFLNSGLVELVHMDVSFGVKNAKGIMCKLKDYLRFEAGSECLEQENSSCVFENGFESCVQTNVSMLSVLETSLWTCACTWKT